MGDGRGGTLIALAGGEAGVSCPEAAESVEPSPSLPRREAARMPADKTGEKVHSAISARIRSSLARALRCGDMWGRGLSSGALPDPRWPPVWRPPPASASCDPRRSACWPPESCAGPGQRPAGAEWQRGDERGLAHAAGRRPRTCSPLAARSWLGAEEASSGGLLGSVAAGRVREEDGRFWRARRGVSRATARPAAPACAR